MDEKPTTLVKALLMHCKRDAESLTDFRHQFSALNDADKAWFKDRFAVEYGYNLS